MSYRTRYIVNTDEGCDEETITLDDLPDAIHLLSMLVDERGDGVGRPHIFANPEVLVVPPLELSCSRAGGSLYEASVRCGTLISALVPKGVELLEMR